MKDFTASFGAGKLAYVDPAVQRAALMKLCTVNSPSLVLELEVVAVKWHGECALCSPQLRATAIRCRAQTTECGTVWGRPPMSTPPPSSPPAAAGRDTKLEHGNQQCAAKELLL